ncbi:hypothetical protein KJZ71_02620 [Patescibacteria group bacterium]|uniref:Uncharacterized protein n=1 Tax=candidate division WWE3 bacterium TaxID=2053526 RepID=A0A928Y6J2_UNCKA|nr:hypothetical protein [candidate division WWE3 bacterium]MCL4732679.1 hypothetical protein [Patescibacteria group bacterium]
MAVIDTIEHELKAMLDRMHEQLERDGAIDSNDWRRTMDLAVAGHTVATDEAWKMKFSWQRDPVVARKLHEKARRFHQLQDLLRAAHTPERQEDLLRELRRPYSLEDHPALNR